MPSVGIVILEQVTIRSKLAALDLGAIGAASGDNPWIIQNVVGGWPKNQGAREEILGLLLLVSFSSLYH